MPVRLGPPSLNSAKERGTNGALRSQLLVAPSCRAVASAKVEASREGGSTINVPPAAPAARWDAFHFRRPRLGRRLL